MLDNTQEARRRAETLEAERGGGEAEARAVALEAELAEIRRQGYAIENGEYRIGLRSVSAPVFDVNGQAAYAVCVVGMFRRVNSPELERAVRLLLEAAERISFELGYRGVYRKEMGHAAD